jgi:hypothetical protein
MTTQFTTEFSLKCQPIMLLHVSDDYRCLVGPDVRVSGAVGLRSSSLARNFRRSVRASRSWALESLAPGSTSGAGKSMMLSEMRIEFVSC